MATEEARPTANYYNVLADGKFHLTVPEGTEGAILRTFETSDGATGSKWEKIYQSVSGLITKVEFYDGHFGKNLLLTIEDEGFEPLVVSLGTGTSFGEDMLKKLLAIDIMQPVKLVPYALVDEKTKRTKKGMTVYQNGEKVTSYFHTYDKETKKTTNINGYPHVPVAKGKKLISSDEWKMHFMQARLFMIEQVMERFGLSEEMSEADRAFNGLDKKEDES